MSEPDPFRRRYRIRWVGGWSWWKARDDFAGGRYIVRYRLGPLLLRIMVG